MPTPRRFFTLDENTAAGLVPGTSTSVQQGVTDADDGTVIEQGSQLPAPNSPQAGWLLYDCELEVRLDAGLVKHMPLPQSAFTPDTLSSVDVANPAVQDSLKTGVNLVSNRGGVPDVIQQVATSDYLFILRGYGLRVAYQIPIPGLVTVAGVPAYPHPRQRVIGPKLAGNYGGVPLWFAEWELWYYVTLPPRGGQVPPANLAMRIRGDALAPDFVQAPYGVPDANAVQGAVLQPTGPTLPGGGKTFRTS